MFVKTNKMMEKHGQTVFLILLVALILPLILVFGPGSCRNLQTRSVPKDFGTIGSHTVSVDEFKQHYFAYIITQFYLEPGFRQKPMLPSLRKAYDRDNIKRYARGAIVRMQLLALAKKQKLNHVSKEELKKYRDGLPVFQDSQGKYDPAKYISFRDQYVKKQPITVQNFTDMMRQNIAIRRVFARFSGDYDSLAGARIAAVAGLAPVDYRFKDFPAGDPAKQTVTDEEIKKLYDNESAKYMTHEKRSGRIAVFKKVYKDLGIKEPTAKELAAYHAKHIRDYTKIRASHILISYKGADSSEQDRSKDEAKKRAEEVLKKVNKDNFKEICLEYSDGPSRSKDGDLGWFSFDGMAKPFSEAAFKLKKGEISGIVETKFGFHIIMNTEEPKKQSWKSVEGILRKKIEDERFEAALAAKAEAQYKKERAKKWTKHQVKAHYMRISSTNPEPKDEKKLDLDMARNIRKEAVASKKDLLKFHADLHKKYPQLRCTVDTRDFYDTQEPGLPDYLKKAAALKKGEFTEVVEHGGAFYICQKIDEREIVPFEDAKSKIIAKLRTDANAAAIAETSKNAKAFLDKITGKKLTGDAVRKEFDRLAKEGKILVVDTPFISSDDKGYFGTIYGGMPKAALNNLLSKLTNSKPLHDKVISQPGFNGVLCLKDIEQSRKETLAEASADIKEKIAQSKAKAAAFKKAQDFFKKVKEGLKKKDRDRKGKAKLLIEYGFVEPRENISDNLQTPCEHAAAKLVDPRKRKGDERLLVDKYDKGAVIAYILGYAPAKLEKVEDSVKRMSKWQRNSLTSTVKRVGPMGMLRTLQGSGYSKILDDMYPFRASERFRSILSDDDEKMTSSK